MSIPFWSISRAWIFVSFCALGFLVWADYERAERVLYVTNTDGEAAVVDANSPTGYAGGKRWLIVPEHNNRSYQWIAETQQMLARHEWRVRQIDYENAPFGREVNSASPYRWWLGLIAWCDHTLSGRPLGLSVERAALLADPLAHLLLLVGTTIFVAWQFGALPAALLAVGLVSIYPFAGSFLPGVPGDQSFARVCALWSVLPLLAGTACLRSPAGRSQGEMAQVGFGRTPRRAQRLFFLAGVAGGLGLWVSAATQTPVLGGIALGGILNAAVVSRGAKTNQLDPRETMPWRTWALGGATTCLAAYLIEYFPAHMELRLQVNHPLYGVAWIGAGELLALIESWLKRGKSYWTLRKFVSLFLAFAAVAALPVALKLGGSSLFLIGDLSAARLSCLPNGVVAKNVAAWVARDGLTWAVGATCLPLLLLGTAVWLFVRCKSENRWRTGIAVALGTVLVTLPLAFLQLAWWNVVDGILLALFVAGSAALDATAGAGRSRWLSWGLAGLVFLPGIFQLVPPRRTAGNIEFTRLEVEGLIERALAHWIADRADPGGPVVLLPPDRTTSWCFHGGLRGLGTANWENRDGLVATVRIVTATTASEAFALLRQRDVAFIILPSWDSDLDEFARWTLRNPEDAFVMALHHWALPPWLRPLPYNLPAVGGFEGQSVVILKVTDEDNRAAALSRLAEYFVETNRPDQAALAGQALQRFPADLGALVALAQVEKAGNDANGFAKTFSAILSSLSSGFDRILSWDRRVSLAVVLAMGERPDLAREQVRWCLKEINEARIRSLTTGSLYRLLILGKAYDLAIPNQMQRELALHLLPDELRGRL